MRTLSRTPTSTVTLCRRDGSARPVAVKTGRMSDAAAMARFRREARFMEAVRDSPHVLRILGSGVLGTGAPYLILEFAAGGSYADLLRRGVTLAAGEALDVGVRMASALHALHARGIVHRDVKPSNMLITEHGPVLADFGIAATVYDSGAVTGWSPLWAAPEVTEGRSGGSEAADCYALAATLAALMTGRPPDGGMLPEAIPGDVRTVLRRAMDPDPDRRFPTALAFGERLREMRSVYAADDRASRQPTRGPVPQPTPQSAPHRTPYASAHMRHPALSALPARPAAGADSPTGAPTGAQTGPRTGSPKGTTRGALKGAFAALAAAAALVATIGMIAVAPPDPGAPVSPHMPLGPSLYESPSYPTASP
ncbi:kinase [Bifidobacterium sp. DSM 109958]|uniref:non-specific serine/threonine protein kinase n=1 Tax=Bifidobacterium moraviense TaxID=2675323 RepID=A0A7Y0F1X4_9BIFI|nr:serine/threonine-protein kinase [Bifidobacterium sp. DSM 109958]NMN00523.1 kinase [Bifidobacterium sp. DSM 109958]